MNEKVVGIGESTISDIGLTPVKSDNLPVIYSGVEGSKDHYSNHAECLQNESSILFRFFNYRPFRRAPLETKIVGNNVQVMIGELDTIEYALQTSVVLPVEAARQLKEMLDNLFLSYDNKSK